MIDERLTVINKLKELSQKMRNLKQEFYEIYNHDYIQTCLKNEFIHENPIAYIHDTADILHDMSVSCQSRMYREDHPEELENE